MNQANGFSFEFWRVARCRSRHRVDSLRRLSHPKLWFVRRPGSSPLAEKIGDRSNPLCRAREEEGVYTLRDRVHACTLQAESVHGACKEVCTRLHACTPRKTHANRPLQSLQDGSNQAAPTPPAGYAPRKVLISSGIWRTISENPCQKISKCSPHLTNHRHTKRARVHALYAYKGVEDDGAQRPWKIATVATVRTGLHRRNRRKI